MEYGTQAIPNKENNRLLMTTLSSDPFQLSSRLSLSPTPILIWLIHMVYLHNLCPFKILPSFHYLQKRSLYH